MVDNLEIRDILSYLLGLGLSREEASIYVSLVEHGPSTPLLLSRATHINRTKVYRTIEKLVAKKMAMVEIDTHSTKVSPSPLDRLSEMLREKQRKVATETAQLPAVERALASLGAQSHSDTTVRFYRGKSGIEQMVWNVLKAQSEIVGYTTYDLSRFVGEKFMDEFVAEFVRRNLSMRDLYGQGYVKSELKPSNWNGRVKSLYISPSILSIPHQMDVYDETVTFYSYSDGEVFGVEIVNPKVAHHQKQLFELAWEKAHTSHPEGL